MSLWSIKRFNSIYILVYDESIILLQHIFGVIKYSCKLTMYFPILKNIQGVSLVCQFKRFGQVCGWPLRFKDCDTMIHVDYLLSKLLYTAANSLLVTLHFYISSESKHRS